MAELTCYELLQAVPQKQYRVRTLNIFHNLNERTLYTIRSISVENSVE